MCFGHSNPLFSMSAGMVWAEISVSFEYRTNLGSLKGITGQKGNSRNQHNAQYVESSINLIREAPHLEMRNSYMLSLHPNLSLVSQLPPDCSKSSHGELEPLSDLRWWQSSQCQIWKSWVSINKFDSLPPSPTLLQKINTTRAVNCFSVHPGNILGPDIYHPSLVPVERFQPQRIKQATVGFGFGCLSLCLRHTETSTDTWLCSLSVGTGVV